MCERQIDEELETRRLSSPVTASSLLRTRAGRPVSPVYFNYCRTRAPLNQRRRRRHALPSFLAAPRVTRVFLFIIKSAGARAMREICPGEFFEEKKSYIAGGLFLGVGGCSFERGRLIGIARVGTRCLRRGVTYASQWCLVNSIYD